MICLCSIRWFLISNIITMSEFSRNTLLLWLTALWWMGCIGFAMSVTTIEKHYNELSDRYHALVHVQESQCYDLLVNNIAPKWE